MFEIKLLNLLQTYEKHVDQSYLGKIIANKVYKEKLSSNYENHQKIAKYWENNLKELIIDCSRVDNVQKFIIQ